MDNGDNGKGKGDGEDDDQDDDGPTNRNEDKQDDVGVDGNGEDDNNNNEGNMNQLSDASGPLLYTQHFRTGQMLQQLSVKRLLCNALQQPLHSALY